MPRISVIIPVFNLEKYLSECLNSLLVQTYRDYEIIIVDDGSTDQSATICKEYEEKFCFIKYYRQHNSGVSAARNKGLDFANGELIVFVDGDDIVSRYYLEHLAKLMESDVEMGVVEYTSKEDQMCNKSQLNCNIVDVKILEERILIDNAIGGYLWNKVFHKNLIEEHCIRFIDDITIWEDLVFVLTYLKSVNKCAVSENVDYYYRSRENSAVATMSLKKFESKVFAAQKLISIECGSSIENKNIVENMYVNSLFDYTYQICKSNSIPRKLKLKKIKELIKKTEIKRLNKYRILKIAKMIIRIIVV